MKCEKCGKELSANEKYCSECGAKAGSNSASEQPLQEKQPTVTFAESVHATNGAPAGCAPEGNSPQSLKAAVAQNKKRSRRHVPIIVLMALALALMTSVAYAAFYVYTYVWLPSQQQQTSDPAQEERDLAQEANIAYAEIIQQYSDCLKETASLSAEVQESDLASRYPKTNSAYLSAASGGEGHAVALYYLTSDLNADGVPELIIAQPSSFYRKTSTGTNRTDCIVSIWSYQQNGAVNVANSSSPGTDKKSGSTQLSLLPDGKILKCSTVVHSGQTYGIDSYSIMALNQSEMLASNNENTNWTIEETLSAIPAADPYGGQDGPMLDWVKCTTMSKDGSETSQVISEQKYLELEFEFFDAHPSDSLASWTQITP